MSDSPQKLEIIFEERKDKPTIAVTGAFGGPSPDMSNIMVHLYVEGHSLPNIIRYDMDEHGAVDMSEVGDRISRGHITREVQATLVLAPEIALKIGLWLQKHANAMLNPE